MEQRIDIVTKGGNALKALYGIGGYLMKSSVDKHLQDLLSYRVAQINNCAYCMDMHSKDLRAHGETEQRIFVLSGWRETPFYTNKERAALAYTEAVTANHVPDEIFDETSKHFSEQEVIDLTLAITSVNTWTKINHAFRPIVGSYQIGQWG
ncbi:MAG: carboxymuconolactone decarboxylase family protein [Bacteroidetes bacterium]|nr:carboxymuconolactone decarboxylase family protein [Bacteroidota bacterium]